MLPITTNEMRALLTIAKNYSTKYNAHKLSKELNISAMGALKITRKLQEQGHIDAERIGKANIFRISYENAYTRQLLSLLLRKEAEEVVPRVKRWVTELRKLARSARIGVLYGSTLKKDEHEDIDVLVVLEQHEHTSFMSALSSINQLSAKRVHPLQQTQNDLQENLRARDPVIMNAIKGVVLFGYDAYVKVLTHGTQQEQGSVVLEKSRKGVGK